MADFYYALQRRVISKHKYVGVKSSKLCDMTDFTSDMYAYFRKNMQDTAKHWGCI
jgi:hypothetical protein